MAYQSLYRKYRSQDFNTIAGQKHIIQTLKNAIANNRLGHAYIFSGPRGTGKTSTARILAKALNCETGMTVNPCLKCASCEKIKNGTAIDVIEIDAASNRGIDEIRQLREQVNFVPVEGRYKVYIIDEVHMLTMEAFNALLKTLEEPPSHTLFILATTELQKLPATILSRCQRMDFKRITTPEIIEHLKFIAGAENVTIDDRSLSYIARTADGCMRDAISLLDQLISYKGNSLVFDDVLAVMGTSDNNVLLELGAKLLTRDVKSVLDFVEELVVSGKNILQLNKDFIGCLRDIMLAKFGAVESIEAGSEYIAKLQEFAAKLSLAEIKNLIILFSKADTDMRWHANSRLIFELAVMEFCFVAKETVKIEQTAAKPEKVIVNKPVAAIVPSIEKPSLKSMVSQFSQKEEIKPQPVASVQPEPNKMPDTLTMADLKHAWQNVLGKVRIEKPALFILLCESNLKEVSNNKVVLSFKENFSFHKDKILKEANKQSIEKIFKAVYGRDLRLEAVIEKEILQEVGTPGLSAIKSQPQDPQMDQILSIFPGKVVSSK